VIAYRRGSIPEVIDDGVTGFVGETLNDMVEAVERVASLDRANCRQAFDARFTVERMAQDYLAVYQQLSADDREEPTGASGWAGSQIVLDRW